METSMIFILLTIGGNICIGGEQISYNVDQAPKEVILLKGGSVTFYCIFPISKDHSWVRVKWWKQGENKYQNTGTDDRKRSGQINQAGGYFELNNAKIQDSGVYRCSVTRNGMAPRNSTGSRLVVYALPTPLKIFTKIPEMNSAANCILVCETAAFHPENFTLNWYKNGVNATLEIKTEKKKNVEGLYMVSSSLIARPPFQSDTKYTCLISHASLNSSAQAVIAGSECSAGKLLSAVALGCAVGGLIILVLIVVIWLWYRKPKNKGKEERFGESNRHEELGAVAAAGYIAATPLSKPKYIPKRKRDGLQTTYGQTKRDNSSDELSYATLAFTGTRNVRKCTGNTEYAELQMHKHSGST